MAKKNGKKKNNKKYKYNRIRMYGFKINIDKNPIIKRNKNKLKIKEKEFLDVWETFSKILEYMDKNGDTKSPPK